MEFTQKELGIITRALLHFACYFFDTEEEERTIYRIVERLEPVTLHVAPEYIIRVWSDDWLGYLDHHNEIKHEDEDYDAITFPTRADAEAAIAEHGWIKSYDPVPGKTAAFAIGRW